MQVRVLSSPPFYFRKVNTLYPHTHRPRNGYLEIWCPEHPRNRDGYVYEHTLVMERSIGRYLYIGEVIHHVDENKANNTLENLVLLASRGDHARVHKHLQLGIPVSFQPTGNDSYTCVKVRVTPRCSKCGNSISVNKTGLCRACYLENGLQLAKPTIPSYEVLEEEHKNGASYQSLANKYGTSYQTIRSRIRKSIII